MYKIFTSSIIILSLFIFGAGEVNAQNLGSNLTKRAAGQAGYDVAGTTNTSLSQTIGEVIKGVLSFAGVIFLLLMVYSGYLWMTARGNDTQIDKAQDIIRSSIIGLIIVIGSYGITNFVVNAIINRTTSGGAPSSSQNTLGTCAWEFVRTDTSTGRGSQSNVTAAQCSQLCNGGIQNTLGAGVTVTRCGLQ